MGCNNNHESKSIDELRAKPLDSTKTKEQRYEYGTLKEVLSKEFDTNLENFDYILFFNNKGCASCNKRFFKDLNEKNFNSNVLIVYSGGKHMFDYNKINDTYSNQIIDEYTKFERLEFLEISSVIVLDSNKIDTLLRVDATFSDYNSFMNNLIHD